MTRTLILMRHAKSSWDTPGLGDHGRPLNDRGRRSAKVLGDWLRDNDLLPDQVLCSSSERTRETLDLLRLPVTADYSERLYLAEPDELFTRLRRTSGRRVLMLGHNPGIAEFAAAILSRHPGHARFNDFPTGATLLADFEVARWDALTWGSGQPRNFVIPRELLAE